MRNRVNLRQQIIEVCEADPRSSAVGSAPRSGRGGRAFESPLLDKRTANWLPFLYGDSPPSGFLSRFAQTIIAYSAILESPLLSPLGTIISRQKDSQPATLFVWRLSALGVLISLRYYVRSIIVSCGSVWRAGVVRW